MKYPELTEYGCPVVVYFFAGEPVLLVEGVNAAQRKLDAAARGGKSAPRSQVALGGRWRQSLPITRWLVRPSQIDLDSKTPVQIVLWKNTHAVRMFSVKAVLAAMIEGLALKVIGLANI
ncbi:MAG: hypothetical protein WB820_05345 [Rhodoplanes sp.]